MKKEKDNKKEFTSLADIKCPKCGSTSKDHEIKNYNMMWHDGDVYCRLCNTYVRMYDAG